MSISAQQLPYLPEPEFWSLAEPPQPSTLACYDSLLVSLFLRGRWRARTYLSVDELDVGRTLAVAVSGAILGTSFVGGILGHAAILVHLGEVDGAVKAARKIADVNVEGELLVQQVEHAIFGIAGHQVHTRPDIGAVVVFGHELELERAGRGGRDAVRLLVISSIDGAVLRTRLSVGACGCVPGVASVAVGVSRGDVRPSPVGLEGYGKRRG